MSKKCVVKIAVNISATLSILLTKIELECWKQNNFNRPLVNLSVEYHERIFPSS